jgi:chromosome partitioning protein
MKTIAIALQKGGVGKTATAVQLSAALARSGKRVLLIDLDPQADATDKLLQTPGVNATAREDKKGSVDIILQQAALVDVVRPTHWGVDLCVASEELSNAEASIVGEVGRERIVAEAIEAVPAGKWDICFIDCPPSLNLLTVNALTAADGVLAPVRAARESLRSLKRYNATIDKIRKRLNPKLRPLGVLLCGADERERVTEDSRAILRKTLGDAFWPVEVRVDSTMKSADLSHRSNAVRDYEAVAEELMRRIGFIEEAAVQRAV